MKQPKTVDLDSIRLDVSDLTKLQTKQLLDVVTVAESGSIRRAASKIGVGQSAISRRIQNLEDYLGVSLFERRASGAQLTQAGRAFVSHARSILTALKASRDAARDAGIGEAGHLRIGIVGPYSNGPFYRSLGQFVSGHTDVRLEVIEMNRSNLITELANEELDAVVAAGGPDENFDGFELALDQVVVAVQEDGPFADYQQLRWKDLTSSSFIVSTHDPGPEISDYILRRTSDLGISVKVSRLTLSRDNLMMLVGIGAGISVGAQHWIGNSYPNVKFIPVGGTDEVDTIPYSLMWNASTDNPALRRFISLARIQAKRNGALS